MLLCAAASRWHWAQVGGPEEIATGDWQVAHAASLIGLADTARLFAGRNLAAAESLGWQGWRRASAHEGMARALASAGDMPGRDHHVTLARAALASETDADDAAVIEAQISSIGA